MQPSNEMLSKLRALAAMADSGARACCEGCRCTNQTQVDMCNGLPRRDVRLAREILEDLARGE
jgi:hypothetical protein